MENTTVAVKPRPWQFWRYPIAWVLPFVLQTFCMEYLQDGQLKSFLSNAPTVWDFLREFAEYEGNADKINEEWAKWYALLQNRTSVSRCLRDFPEGSGIRCLRCYRCEQII